MMPARRHASTNLKEFPHDRHNPPYCRAGNGPLPLRTDDRGRRAFIDGIWAILGHGSVAGLGEALEMSKAGQVRILAITAAERVPDAPEVKTLTEMGNPTVFANWRGFFAAPGTPKEKVAEYNKVLSKMYDTSDWETVRARNGWVNAYKSSDDFYKFLEDQETQVGSLMRELGFLK